MIAVNLTSSTPPASDTLNVRANVCGSNTGDSVPGRTRTAFSVVSISAGGGGGGGVGGGGGGGGSEAVSVYVFVVLPSAAVTTIVMDVLACGVTGTGVAVPAETLVPWIVIVAVVLFGVAVTCTLLTVAASGT